MLKKFSKSAMTPLSHCHLSEALFYPDIAGIEVFFFHNRFII